MNIIDIINKKKKGKKLNYKEIEYFIKGTVNKTIADYQISALLMAICLKGMDNAETYNLTLAMKCSGEVLDNSFAGGITVDKHSTGGVSDTVTLVAVPVLAQAGLKVIKLSGRGLSYTGGTIDKLESIPDFKTELTGKEIKKNVLKCGAVICSQSQNLAPADKILYALRDVTSTVDSLPLIASSIMSKKLAAGNNVILLDVKYGSGAFIKTAKEAVTLAKCMVDIGTRDGKKCAAIISSMEQPLTKNVGCNLELKSAISVLKGSKNDLYTVSKEICGRIMVLAGIEKDIKKAYGIFDELIESGKALKKFEEIIKCQGGNSSVLFFDNLLPEAAFNNDILSGGSGYITKINGEAVGRAVCRLGGGREKKGDAICHSAGLKLYIRLNDYVNKGDKIATLYTSDKEKFAEAGELINSCYKLSKKPIKIKKLIYAYVTPDSIKKL